MPKSMRVYSDFWSNKEYMFATGQIVSSSHLASRVRRKILRAIWGLKQITNPEAINTTMLIQLLDAAEHLMRIKGLDDYADKISEIASELEAILAEEG